MSIEVVKGATMDHLMSGKFTSMVREFHFFFFPFILIMHESQLHSFCSCTAHLVAVMAFRKYTIRVGKVTTISWYVVLSFAYCFCFCGV